MIFAGKASRFCRGGCCLALGDRGTLCKVAILHISRAFSPCHSDDDGNTAQRRNCLDYGLWKEICGSGGQVEDLLCLGSPTASKVGLS